MSATLDAAVAESIANECSCHDCRGARREVVEDYDLAASEARWDELHAANVPAPAPSRFDYDWSLSPRTTGISTTNRPAPWATWEPTDIEYSAPTPERSRPLPMTIETRPDRIDVRYWEDEARALVRRNLDSDSVELRPVVAYDPDWTETATRAFHFLRANADRRYSNSALMKVLLAAERQYGERDPLPLLIEVTSPFAYDPVTEVKSGGVLGVLVQLNDDYNRALLAVTPNARGKRVGEALLVAHRAYGEPSLFVHRSNIPGQQFLLRQGFMPQTINAQGAIRFARYECQDEEV